MVKAYALALVAVVLASSACGLRLGAGNEGTAIFWASPNTAGGSGVTIVPGWSSLAGHVAF